jgi:hypothetical protein
MHKGEDTEFYLRKGFRVVAFEADPDLVRHCNIRLQDFIDQGRLAIVEGAIADMDSVEAGRKAIFYKNDTVSVWGTVCLDWAERNERLGASSHTLKVDLIDCVGVLQRYGVPHYMKIDIEGLDMVCVNALRRFRERPDYISVESDKTSFANIEREINTLVDLGYNSFQAVEQSAISHAQSPPYPASEGNYVDYHFEAGSSGLFGSELGGEWEPKHKILRQYRVIRLGYYLVGDDGIVSRWKFRGAGKLRSLIQRSLRPFTNAAVPGWYDTHARHSSVSAGKE